MKRKTLFVVWSYDFSCIMDLSSLLYVQTRAVSNLLTGIMVLVVVTLRPGGRLQQQNFLIPNVVLIVFLLHGGDRQDDRLCLFDLFHHCRKVSGLPGCCHLWRRHHFQAITNVVGVVIPVGIATDVHWPTGWHFGQLGSRSGREGVTGRDRNTYGH